VTGGHAVSAVAHAVRNHRSARGRPLEAIASSVRVPLVLPLTLVLGTAPCRVSRLTASAVGENSEHYGKPGVERRFRVAARSVATCVYTT